MRKVVGHDFGSRILKCLDYYQVPSLELPDLNLFPIGTDLCRTAVCAPIVIKFLPP